MINSYLEFENFIKKMDKPKKILLHACCAPCSTWSLDVLKDFFEITIFYSNSNIYPTSEYDKRYNEIVKLLSKLPYHVNLVKDNYDYSEYQKVVEGLENLGEKSLRCYECYKLRLERSAKYAKENNFDFFSTTLSISPYKISRWINEIGYAMEEKYEMPFLYSDFKKKEGYKNSILLSKKYDLYRQEYCGCEYSMKEALRDE